MAMADSQSESNTVIQLFSLSVSQSVSLSVIQEVDLPVITSMGMKESIFQNNCMLICHSQLVWILYTVLK